MIEPGFGGDWEAQMIAQDENLEITGGFGVERAKGELIQREETAAG